MKISSTKSTPFSFNYNLKKELDKFIEYSKKKKFKKILIHLPDGLKPIAGEIAEYLEKEGFVVLIWGGSCWGSCDTLSHFKLEEIVDCILHVGHEEFNRKNCLYQIDNEK